MLRRKFLAAISYLSFFHIAMRLLLGWMTLACIVAALSIANPTLADKCQTCKSFVAAFTRAMDKTKSDGFGGGNTDWEERSLGAYAKR